jgi:NTE family protein
MHIPIDYISGTSMGSIVGGLYATGATTEDLQTLIKTTNWVEIFSDRPPREMLPYRTKEDDRRYLEGLQMGLDKKGLHLSKGLINGQKLMFLLESNTQRVSTKNFGDLPIPFNCVATDIVSGNKYVFSQGSLPVAIRSSMSLPAIFAPVEHDGLLLVDGGIADNLPVDVVRAMGADVVIAVDISTPPLDRERITSPLAVFNQVMNVLMQKEIDIQAGQADILLRPDLKGYSLMDFEHALTLVPVGEKLVDDQAAVLSKYAVSAEEYAAWTSRVRGLPPSPLNIDFLVFAGTDPLDEGLLRGKMSFKPGEPINMENLKKDLLLVYNKGDYASVTYEIVQRGDQRGVVITAKPNPTGPNYMRFGIDLQSDFRYNSNWSIFAGLRFTRLNRLGAEWKSDLEIGLNQRLTTEWYQPLTRSSRVFVAPYLKYNNELDYVFPNQEINNPEASYRTTILWAGVDLGFNLGLSGELRIGPRWGHANYSRAVGPVLFPSLEASLGGIALAYKYDRLDSADLPTKGVYIALTAFDSETAMGADANYQKAELKIHAFQPLGARSGIFEFLSGGTSFGNEVPRYDWFRVGGPGSFGGYMEGQMAGPYYAAVRLGYQYKFATLPAIIGRGLYFMAFADAGKAWVFEFDDPSGKNDMKYSGTVGFGSSTKLGPVFFGFSYAQGGNQMLYLSLGKRW